ncbi:MAG: 7-cyano-7-deazaguanine synthase QueC [Parachlamydiales bacterium]|jgi:7-cyano-7-deazaguanine synthase
MKAIILLSGGVDSAVALAYALSEGRECIALSFDYGQRHRTELDSAAKISQFYNIPHIVLQLPSWGAEAVSLLLSNQPVPTNRTKEEIEQSGVAPTYVPARNTIFLSYGIAVAEVHGAYEIYIGSNADDHFPYPDCRPAYFEAFQQVANLATKQGIEGRPSKIIAPFVGLKKHEVIALGKRLGSPLELTFSCYAPTAENAPCGVCDACRLRR